MSVSSNSSVVASINLMMSRRSIKFVRYVESIFQVLESIGGFKESLHSIILFMIIFFQERLFKGAFLKQLYFFKMPK